MPPNVLFPAVAGLRVDRLWREGNRLQVVATTTLKRARCPCCGRRSRRVHSHYVRTLTDLPCCGMPVHVQLHTRRFWCRMRWCRRRIFCERVPDLMAPWARRTTRLQEHLRHAAGALGGDPGARHAHDESMPVSSRTLLRLLRATPVPPVGPVRVLGVDDWSRRKGRDFGTILVDLEAHRVLDLLPDRTAATVAAWLRQHPEVEIVSRDRASAYADGIRQGAPQAIQVADRFHVLKNLTEVVERVLSRQHAALRTATLVVATQMGATPAGPAAPSAAPGEEAPPRRLTTAQVARQARRERRLARYQDVLALHGQGASQCQIAARLGMGRRTIRRFLRADDFPERAPAAPRWSALRPHEPYLRERWTAGCDNAFQLWRELSARGYPGAASTVRQFLARWRPAPGRPGKKGPPRPQGPACGQPAISTRLRGPLPVRGYSARQTTWLLLKAQDEDQGICTPGTLHTDPLTDEERAYVVALRTSCPAVVQLQDLAGAFRTLVRTHDATALAGWLRQADHSPFPEVHGFADGLRADRAAVEAGLTLPWSQGQVEGQVNRLKCLKRAMFGRARFDLLRLRVLRVA